MASGLLVQVIDIIPKGRKSRMWGKGDVFSHVHDVSEGSVGPLKSVLSVDTLT